MEIGALFILFVIGASVVIGETITERKEKKAKTERYIDSLERTIFRQERALQRYRFERLQKELETGEKK